MARFTWTALGTGTLMTCNQPGYIVLQPTVQRMRATGIGTSMFSVVTRHRLKKDSVACRTCLRRRPCLHVHTAGSSATDKNDTDT
jgi:hypothetical protein